ncbi:MAG: threonine--tRNA ligase [Nanoarchaeota archaeon]|nr:threonine--tRNA ligase [Nanoarchaeota archaeon]
MRIITLHCDYIKFKPLKKALKSVKELEDKSEVVVKDPLVVLTAVEKGDAHEQVKQLAQAVQKTADEVKAKNIVLYPYAHLSSNLANPDTAQEYLIEAEKLLAKEGFKVQRAPFGYYKEFELKCKGHPLSELSKEFRSEGAEKTEKPIEVKSLEKDEKEEDPSKLLREISRSKLDTSKLKENDHRILGQKLDLFSFNEAAPGQPFWHNNGLTIYNELVEFWRGIHDKYGYQEVLTPQILDNKVWKVSGHWKLYRENMFLTHYEDRACGIKPMSCPGAMLIYRTKSRSYKDLPLRLCEVGVVHRKELSGVLSGLLRVIRITQDDAHLFVTEEQLQEEILKVIKLFMEILDKFNFTYTFTLSVRSEEKKDKYLGDDKVWNAGEKALADGLKSLKLKFQTMPGEAKFYGPSLDIQIRDSLGREWQCASLQLDFNLPKRFELEYTDKDGKAKTPILLHRVVFGSMERFIAVLLEHTNGVLPFWLSPVQVRIINFTDRNVKSSEKVLQDLKSQVKGLRIDSDLRNTTVNDKVRDAEMQKIPYIIVIGEKEEESKTLAVRTRGNSKPKFGVKMQDLVSELTEKIEKRN